MKDYKTVAEIVDQLAIKLMDRICKDKNFVSIIKAYDNDQLLNMLFLLVTQEKFEHAAIVKKEMLVRNIDTRSMSEYEKHNKVIVDYLNNNI